MEPYSWAVEVEGQDSVSFSRHGSGQEADCANRRPANLLFVRTRIVVPPPHATAAACAGFRRGRAARGGIGVHLRRTAEPGARRGRAGLLGARRRRHRPSRDVDRFLVAVGGLQRGQRHPPRPLDRRWPHLERRHRRQRRSASGSGPPLPERGRRRGGSLGDRLAGRRRRAREQPGRGSPRRALGRRRRQLERPRDGRSGRWIGRQRRRASRARDRWCGNMGARVGGLARDRHRTVHRWRGHVVDARHVRRQLFRPAARRGARRRTVGGHPYGGGRPARRHHRSDRGSSIGGRRRHLERGHGPRRRRRTFRRRRSRHRGRRR